MNIFNMNRKEARAEIRKLLERTPREQLISDLKECGFEVIELEDRPTYETNIEYMCEECGCEHTGIDYMFEGDNVVECLQCGHLQKYKFRGKLTSGGYYTDYKLPPKAKAELTKIVDAMEKWNEEYNDGDYLSISSVNGNTFINNHTSSDKYFSLSTLEYNMNNKRGEK